MRAQAKPGAGCGEPGTKARARFARDIAGVAAIRVERTYPTGLLTKQNNDGKIIFLQAFRHEGPELALETFQNTECE